MKGETLDHIVRPRLPWRDEDDDITECGRPVSDVRSAISTEDAVARAKRLGKTRAAMVTCMTCWTTAERWAVMATRRRETVAPTWDTTAAEVLYRWLGRADDRRRLDAELRSLARLVVAHRSEFDELVGWEIRRGSGRLRSVEGDR